MSLRSKFVSAFAAVALALGLSLAFVPALGSAMPGSQAFADDLVAGSVDLSAQADTKAYTGDVYKIVKEDLESEFGMLSPVNDSLQIWRADGKIHIAYEPSNKTVYCGVYLDADIADSATWSQDRYLPITKGENIEFVIDEKYAGSAVPIAPVKVKDPTATTSSQYYMAIPALSKIAEEGALSPINSERMFVVVKAILEDNDEGQDYLTYYLNGTSYKWAYAGTQDEAVASFDQEAAKPKSETDTKWAAGVNEDIESTYTTWKGETATAKGSKPGYRIPVTIPEGQTKFEIPVVAYATDFTARTVAIDLEAGTIQFGTASDVANVTVKSEVEDVAVDAAATMEYTGYVRPYAGAERPESGQPLSNDWKSTLNLKLTNSVYDQAYVVAYEGTPSAPGAAVESSKDTVATVDADGNLKLAITNEYDTDPKTFQLKDEAITVMMHVANNSGYAEAGTWVQRDLTLSWTNRTTATLTIAGDPLSDQIERLWGQNAYGTMVQAVNEGWESSDTVVVATFGGYWDALAASALAGSEKAPVLLTFTDSLVPETEQLIKSLGAKKAYICGGEAAVSAGVEKAIAGLGVETERLYGATAFDTAEKVSAKAKANLGEACDTCVVATIDGFYDSLSVAPASYALGMPVYLTNGDKVLAASTAEAIKAAGYKKAVIVGGTAAVKDTVEGQLASAGVADVTRLAGDNAWQTSQKIADWGLANGLSAATVGVADGNGFWDALTGAPLVGLKGGPLVLVPHDGPNWDNSENFAYNPYCIDRFITDNAADINKVYVFGGEGAVPAKAYDAIEEALAVVKLTVTNNVSMFRPATSATLRVAADGSQGTLVLPMTSDSMSSVFVGTPTDAAAATETIAFDGEKSTFTIPLTSLDSEPFVLSFLSKNNGNWYARQATLDVVAGTLTFDAWVDPAPANTVDEKIAKIQSQTYTDTTWADCEDAKKAWDALSDAEKALVEEYDYFGLDTGDASKDDPLNADEIGENEILVVSFGTSFNDSRVATIGGVEKALAAAYPDWSVRRAFTAQIIINHIYARDGEKIDNVAQAMDRAVANGVKNLVVQPTHLMHGAEYDELKAEIDKYADKMSITYAEPLLGEVGADGTDVNADKEAVAKAVVAEAAAPEDTALVLMGHGTAHAANVTYTQMQAQMDALGYKNVFVGTVEGEPEGTDAASIIAKVKDAGYKKVILRPLMVVAGDHANNDMADPEDEESWVSQFNASGAFDSVECQIAGLGEIPAIQQIYVAHTGAVLPIELTDGVYALPEMEAGPSQMFNHMEADSKLLKVEGDTATIMFVQDASTKSVTKYSKVALGKSSELVTTPYQATLPEGTVIVEGKDSGTGDNGTKWGFEIPITKAQAEELLQSNGELYICVWNNEGSSTDKIPGWYQASSDIYLKLGTLGSKASK